VEYVTGLDDNLNLSRTGRRYEDFSPRVKSVLRRRLICLYLRRLEAQTPNLQRHSNSRGTYDPAYAGLAIPHGTRVPSLYALAIPRETREPAPVGMTNHRRVARSNPSRATKVNARS